MGLWAKSLRIFHALCDTATQSMRQVAPPTGLSKSSVQRLKQAMERRDVCPQSWLWETEEGQRWLRRWAVATLYPFGLKRGGGAATIGAFFVRRRREKYGGCAPRALRGIMDMVGHASLATARAWEREGSAAGEARPIIGAVDATVLPRRLLVCMDLGSGDVWLEEVAAERPDDTWYALGKTRLETPGVEAWDLVRDRAKALSKLAETGRDRVSIPDLFPLLHDLVQGDALSIYRRLRQARPAWSQAQASLATAQAAAPQGVPAPQAQLAGEATEAEVRRREGVRRDDRHHLATLSLLVPPWPLWDATAQTSQAVAKRWPAASTAIATWVETQGLPLTKKTLEQGHTQLAGVAAWGDVWWQGVGHDVTPQVSRTPLGQRGVAELLLPLMSWQAPRSRTRCPRRKARRVEALQAVQAAFARPPLTTQLTPQVLAGWQAWAAEHARAFPRASSAVAGRNGSVSQMPRNHRGVPQRRYQVWSVLHNFDGRASDGSPLASRFCRRDVPDLFATVLSHINEVPRPRRRKQAIGISA
jgi:Family of unknown function (DUF6399)